MKIYAYHPITGEFIGLDTARRDPEDSQNWIRPADTTDIAPPEPGDHQAAVFDRQAKEWSLVDDWRGHKYWTEDGQQHSITTLGATPPEDALDEPPPPTPEEVAKALRSRRNGMLRASDWTQLPDSPLSQAQRDDYRAHRQALRDITEDPAWPDVPLPEPPAL
jgi:hypothetical protein